MTEQITSKIREQIKILEDGIFNLDPTDPNLAINFATYRSQHFLLNEWLEAIVRGDFSDD